MKISKASYSELRNVYDDLKSFLGDKMHSNFGCRIIVLEYYSLNADVEHIVYFDSQKNEITRVMLRNKKFRKMTDTEIFSFFEMSQEQSIIEADRTDADEGQQKKQSYYVITEFYDEPNPVFTRFLTKYQKQILQRFNKRSSLTAGELLSIKETVFNETITSFIDDKLINALSGSQYENRELFGSVIYIEKREDVEIRVRFAKEIEFNVGNLRLIRKILEMSDSKYSVVILNNNIIGLGFGEKILKKIQFTGKQKWVLLINKEEVIRFSRGELYFGNSFNATNEIPKGFIQKKYEKKLNDLISILTKKAHGALLIITDEAKQEVERLSCLGRGYAIEPIDLAENMIIIKNIASVDGAVFMDRQLKCFGAGIILDGVAKRPGSSARGSRYNSSVCYLDSKTKTPYLAIVFSEDETVDILHNTVEDIPAQQIS